jgi:hypothetical protein
VEKWRRGIKIAMDGRVEGRRRAIFTASHSFAEATGTGRWAAGLAPSKFEGERKEEA